jgi:hypothetical protein
MQTLFILLLFFLLEIFYEEIKRSKIILRWACCWQLAVPNYSW